MRINESEFKEFSLVIETKKELEILINISKLTSTIPKVLNQHTNQRISESETFLYDLMALLKGVR